MIIKTPAHCAAYTRAIEWAEANPTKISKAELARNADGDPVTTCDPTAECFCVLGRVARELGHDIIGTGYAMLLVTGDVTSPHGDELWTANDDGVSSGNPLAGFEKLKELMA